MTTTPLFGFRLIAANAAEAAKIAAMNENALIFEALFTQRAKSRSTSTPPGSPANGEVWIVPDPASSPAPSGAWAGHGNQITIYYNGWLFALPIQGPRFWIEDESVYVHYDAASSPASWTPLGGVNNAIHDNVAGEIFAITLKGTPHGNDRVIIEDSEDSNNKKSVAISSIGGGGGAVNYGRASRQAVVSLTSGTNTLISWDTEEADVGGFIDVGGANPSRLILPFTGKYRWNIEYVIAAATNLTGMQCVLNKNRAGSTTFNNGDFPGTFLEAFYAAGSSGLQRSCYGGGILEATANDYAELVVWQSSGVSRNTRNVRVTLEYIGT